MVDMVKKAKEKKGSSIGPAKKTMWKNLARNKTLLLMCTPAILFFVVFNYCPLPGAYIAFTNFNYRLGIFGSKFVGFENFRFLIESGKLWLLTRNTVLYNLAFIILGNILSISIAVLMNEITSRSFKKATQSMMFLPYFISAVLVGLLAFNILNYDFGFLNTVIRFLGGKPVKVYATPPVWPVIIVIVNLWMTTGYHSVIYFAAICGISAEIIEAATIDGANILQKIRHIILPSLMPTAVILFLLALGGILRGNFGLFYNLVGPSNAALFPYTDIIETFVYRTLMNQFNFTYSSAVGLYQSVFGFAVVMLANGLIRKFDETYALF